MRIALAESDAPLAEFIKEQLESERWRVDVAGSNAELETQLLAADYWLAMIDFGAPAKESIGAGHPIWLPGCGRRRFHHQAFLFFSADGEAARVIAAPEPSYECSLEG